MATTNNPLLKGVSGKLSNIILKQYQGKTVISAIPDMSRRKLSPKQKDANKMMKMATAVAKRHISVPLLKQRSCERLQVPPNKVFRAIIKEFMITNGRSSFFEETEQEKTDKKTLAALKKIITTVIPDAEIKQFGNRATGTNDPQSDWDFLILTIKDYPNAVKWELQENLFDVTRQQGTRVNILLVQKDKWSGEPEYELLRKRLENELLVIK